MDIRKIGLIMLFVPDTFSNEHADDLPSVSCD